jgi:hypothetical protein
MTPQGPGNPNSNSNLVPVDKHVVDFNEARAQKLEEKRRKTERIFFKQLLGVYSVVGTHTMCPIELVDVSEDGCSFQIPFNPEKPWPKDLAEIPIRVYFSQDSYLEVIVQIQNARPSIENGTRYTRFGCTVDKTIAAYPAYQQFVRFLKLYSEHSHKDMGDVSVFYI